MRQATLPAWLRLLTALYPHDRLLTRPAELAAYESDALTAFRARPAAVVIPLTQEEVVETVHLCHREAIPFVARGSGASLSGGSLPVEGGVVIALNRLNRILRVDPEERLAVVEPGVINLEVSLAAAPFGLYYAPDPSSQPVCTIGGNIAFNSGGAHCLKHGMTANHVLGLKVVLADGEVTHFGGESLEMVGPDLVGLFVGSEGLFGIALEVTLRLLPRPEVYRTLLAAYRSAKPTPSSGRSSSRCGKVTPQGYQYRCLSTTAPSPRFSWDGLSTPMGAGSRSPLAGAPSSESQSETHRSTPWTISRWSRDRPARRRRADRTSRSWGSSQSESRTTTSSYVGCWIPCRRPPRSSAERRAGAPEPASGRGRCLRAGASCLLLGLPDSAAGAPLEKLRQTVPRRQGLSR